jgi:hypothetical protein
MNKPETHSGAGREQHNCPGLSGFGRLHGMQKRKKFHIFQKSR